MTPPEAERRETTSDVKNGFAGSLDDRTSTIGHTTIPLDGQPDPDDPTDVRIEGIVPDLERRIIMARVADQVSKALDRGFSFGSIIDQIEREGSPIPADQIRTYVQTRYAEAETEQLKAANMADKAILDLQNIPQEEIAELDKAFEADIAEKKLQDALDKKCSKFKTDDIGNSQRFVARFGDVTKYCFSKKTWFLWDKTRWSEDEKGMINELAKPTARAIYREAALVDSLDAPSHAKWAIKSAGKKSLEYMLDVAKSDPKISILPADLDNVKRCKNMFNCLNGTLDLSPTVTFREHRKEDLITRIAGVAYDPAAACPLWDAHLRLIFDNKKDLIEAFQEHIGYLLPGGNPEKIFEIWWGESGNNGKTATAKTISQIMGSYARTTGKNTFMQTQRDDADTPRSDLMALRGARLALSPETDKNAPLAVGMIKSLTGGDQQSGREMYQKNEVFDPEFVPILISNHSPRISDTNNAIWNRIRRWPFVVEITKDQMILDYDTQLAAEASGILNWMIAGLERLQARGGKFSDPSELLESTRKYRESQDIVLKFIDERCTLDATTTPTPKTTLYDAYDTWCDEVGEIKVSKRNFYKSLTAHKYSFVQHDNVRCVKGIRIKTTRESEEWEDKNQNED